MGPDLPFSVAGNTDSIKKSSLPNMCWEEPQIVSSQLFVPSLPVEINQQASPQILLPANYSHLAEPTLRAAYLGPELGRAYSHLNSFLPSHTHVMHETVQREIEKQQIREEIIMSEVFRRRVLEAEVRQELMMEQERELASLRGQNNGIPIGSPSSLSLMGFESPTRLPVLRTGGERRFLGERIILSLAEERLRRSHESGGFETLLFHSRSDYLQNSDVSPAVSERAKEKRKFVLLDKPDEDIAGLNRKVSTPSVGLDSSESLSKDGCIISNKKAKIGWFCSVCHISATSEQALNEHLQGKKHKSKEITLRAQRAGKNYSMGLFPKNATKLIEVRAAHDSKSTSESPQPPLLEENVNSVNLKKDLCAVVVYPEAQKKDDQEKDQPVVPETQKNDDQEKDHPVVPEAQKKEESKKNRFRFWCEMCQVGLYSKKIFNAHNKGKKHVRRLEAGRHNTFHDREKTVVIVNREAVVVNRDGKT